MRATENNLSKTDFKKRVERVIEDLNKLRKIPIELCKNKVEKRYEVIKLVLENFSDYYKKKFGNDLKFKDDLNIDEIASIYNLHYWEKNLIHLTPYVTQKGEDLQVIHHYKIISLIELVVAGTNLILDRKVNASFAFYLGIRILQEWNNINNLYIIETLKQYEDKYIHKFTEEHHIWLSNLDANKEFPIFLNSQIWRLFHNYIISPKIGNPTDSYESRESTN